MAARRRSPMTDIIALFAMLAFTLGFGAWLIVHEDNR